MKVSNVFSVLCPWGSYACDLLQEKEAHNGAPNPRILSIDSYFLNEIEKVVKDPDTGISSSFAQIKYIYILSLSLSPLSSLILSPLSLFVSPSLSINLEVFANFFVKQQFVYGFITRSGLLFS